jgi:hypothetical protein
LKSEADTRSLAGNGRCPEIAPKSSLPAKSLIGDAHEVQAPTAGLFVGFALRKFCTVGDYFLIAPQADVFSFSRRIAVLRRDRVISDTGQVGTYLQIGRLSSTLTLSPGKCRVGLAF